MTEWMTVAQASQELGISERTLRRRIAEGRVESKLDDKRRLVAVTNDMKPHEVDSDKVGSMSLPYTELVLENQKLQQRIEKLEAELETERSRLEDNRQRQDTIILQLTRQLEQSQNLLEYHQEPWYRRWFRKGSS